MSDTEQDIVKFEPKSLSIKVLIFLIVMLVGAAVFLELERAKDDSRSQGILLEATQLKQILVEKYNISASDLKELESAFEKEADKRQEQERLNRWTYSNSIFFAFTIMTTIGEYLSGRWLRNNWLDGALVHYLNRTIRFRS